MTETKTSRSVGPLSVRGAFAPSSTNAERRTVDVVWTTGAKVLRNSWFDGPTYEELSLDPAHVRMGRLNNGAPFLADHDGGLESVMGVVESARLEAGRGIATVRFPAEGINPSADKLFSLVRDGIVQNISVGYRTYKSEKVDGGEIPTFRATDWEPYEISAVAMGADDQASFRSSNPNNECVFVTRGDVKMSDTKGTGTTQTNDMPSTDNEAKRAAEVAAAAQAERTRVAEIMDICQTAKLPELARQAVDDGTTVDAMRKVVLTKLAERSDAQGIQARGTFEVGETDREKFQRGAEAWLLEKHSRGVVAQAKAKGVAEFKDADLDGGKFRGLKLSDIARACCERAGVSTKNVYGSRNLIELAIRAGNSTGDFSVLFENVLRKSMRAAYSVQEDTWRRFCGTDTVQDFKDASRYMNGSFGTLPVVSENEEYRNINIPDGSKLTISTETRGGIVALTRQAMINDDMGALVDVVTRFGRSASRSIEKAVYDMLQDNSGLGPTMSDSSPFFDNTARANVSTGAALSIAALDADRIKMRQQMDADSNDYLDLQPSILVVPVGLESAAKILNESAFDHSGSALQKPNAVRGMFADIVSSPRLTHATHRYLFTSAKEALKVVFLEGSGEGPTLESQDGFRVDCTEWKLRIDFKVNPYDPKTGLYNAGA